MNYLKSITAALILLVGISAASVSQAALPWGSTAPLEVSGATPTCTFTSTALACIENMTANVTSVTYAGMTAGNYYTLIWMQDGTGSRTLASGITGAPALLTAESAANGYAVWVVVATSASAATFVADYPNVSLKDTFTATQTSNGTSVATLAIQAQPTIVVPGMTASTDCKCLAQTLPSTWQSGIQLTCLPQTNALQCVELNPSAASVTPAAVSLSIRIGS